MRLPLILAACLALSGCGDGPGPQPGPHHGGRYIGIGTYPAGRLWSRQAQAAQPRVPAAATIADDEQIIVTVDSRTGEVRQCGNLSGHCIASNPWSRDEAGAVNLTEHAADLDGEAENAAETANTARPATR